MPADVRIGNTVGFLYIVICSPVEVIIASMFLYNLLGWSAFAGILVLAVATPINSMISKRSMKVG